MLVLLIICVAMIRLWGIKLFCLKKTQMEIQKKIKKHCKKSNFVAITREVAKDWDFISRGYIVDYSNNFVVMQTTDDFMLNGFIIFPTSHITHLRRNKNDKYYDEITKSENDKRNFGISTKVDISYWKTLFNTFLNNEMNIIIECEKPSKKTFTIGKVKKLTKKAVFIHYFGATGFLDKKLTKIKFKNISKVTFADRYTTTFGKYVRT